MATLSELRDRVLRLLADEEFDSDIVDDGINSALDAILPWLFKRSVVEIEGDAETTSFELPTDLYRIIAVFDETSGLYIPQNIMASGQAPGQNLESNQDWMEYPEGWLSLANAPDAGTFTTVHYGAVWAHPSSDGDTLETPTWADSALAYYAASYCLLNQAASAANIRQWNVQVDSGTPIMNPMKDMSSYFLERFRIETERFPGRIRGVHG